jgi:hypothetical protein
MSETMLFFFHGFTTTGKSTISRIASSVYGSPSEGIDWATTGLLYAAGWLAQRAGLLPWPDKQPKQVARYAYDEITRGLTARNHLLDAALSGCTSQATKASAPNDADPLSD